MAHEVELNQAIALIKTGKKNEAIPILKAILRSNRDNEAAWLWISTCADKVEDKIFCYREVLRINPTNEWAKNELTKIENKHPPTQPRKSQNTSLRMKENQSYWKIAAIVIVAFIFGGLILSMIGILVSRSDRVIQTAIVKTRSAIAMNTESSSKTQVSYSLTKTAEPTFTPYPTYKPWSTSTPDRRSSFDKCVQSGSGIRYVISGNNVTKVSLTWENDFGGTSQGDYYMPVCMNFSDFYSGDFVYISAQIIEPTSFAGSITCRIYDGYRVIAEAEASGFPSIASCSGTK